LRSALSGLDAIAGYDPLISFDFKSASALPTRLYLRPSWTRSPPHGLPRKIGGTPMPRFHFNVYGDTPVVDTKGAQLPDITEARHEGGMRFAAIVEQEAKKAILGDFWWMEITDGRGMILIRMDFSETRSPAVKAT
jgi:hypothetical protein